MKEGVLLSHLLEGLINDPLINDLVAAVMIDTPTNKKYYGGDVAAPVFAEIMTQAVRAMQIPPDEKMLGAFHDAKEFKKVSR